MKEFDYSNENIKRIIDKDYFSRNRYLLRLIDLISQSNENSIFAIDGRWGSGKTVFMHQFMYLLKHDIDYKELCHKYNFTQLDITKIECFYFNAWENDLLNNPILNLFNGLTNEYSLLSSEDKEKYNKLVRIFKGVSTKLLSGGLLEYSDFELEKNQLYSPVEEIKKNINEIIEVIKKIKKVDKVVIIIDELDRCRPNYAVELLESLKHFYDNDSLLFLISTDLVQLAHSVRNLYGESFDGDLYLERFFKGIFTLNLSGYENYIKYELNYNLPNNIIYECCTCVINYYDLSVREVSKFIRQIKLLSKDIEYSYFNNYHKIAKILFVPWGLGLKYKNNQLYNRYRTGKMRRDEFDDFLNSNSLFPILLVSTFKTKEEFNVTEELKILYDLYLYFFANDKVKSVDLELITYEKFLNVPTADITDLLDF